MKFCALLGMSVPDGRVQNCLKWQKLAGYLAAPHERGRDVPSHNTLLS